MLGLRYYIIREWIVDIPLHSGLPLLFGLGERLIFVADNAAGTAFYSKTPFAALSLHGAMAMNAHRAGRARRRRRNGADNCVAIHALSID